MISASGHFLASRLATDKIGRTEPAWRRPMSKSSRRTFLRHGALAALAGGSAWPAPAQAAQGATAGPADLVVLGATVFTVDEKTPRAEAFAVKNGRFLAIGTSDEIRRLAGRDTEVIDAGKMTVVPGFIDAHCHPASAGLSHLIDVDCDRRAIAEIQKAIQERAGRTEAGEWVFGFKYDDTKLKDDRPLTR